MRGSTDRPTGSAARLGAIAAAIGVIVLAGMAIPISAAAPAGAVTPASSSETIWAYGAVGNTSINWQGLEGQFVGTATYGFSTTLVQTNTSAQTFTLTENHTVGASIQLTYCRPDCASANFTANYSARAWEEWTSVGNFTTNGTVTLRNGSNVAALALASASTQAAANVTESLTYTANGTTHLFDELFVTASASSSVAFSPALGLVPLNLTSDLVWSAGSAFTANGSWQTSYLVVLPATSQRASSSGNLTGSGNVTLYGSDGFGPVNIHGLTLTSVSVRLGSPTVRRGSADLAAGLDMEDGFALVPRVVDIWAGTGGWIADTGLITNAGATNVDMTSTTGGHLGVDAASWTYSTSVNQYDSASNASPQTVQGGPVSPATAQAESACLMAGACTVGASASGSGATNLGLVALVVVAVVAVVVLVAVVAVMRQRRPPSSHVPAASPEANAKSP